MVDWALGQVHGEAREDLGEVGRRAWDTLAGYLRGSTMDGLVEAVLKAIGLLILGVLLVVPLPLAEGPTTALLVVVLSVAIQNIEGNMLQPLIMGRVIKLHPVVILVSLTTAAALAGIIGAFLVVPCTAIAVNIAAYFREDRPRQLEAVDDEERSDDGRLREDGAARDRATG